MVWYLTFIALLQTVWTLGDYWGKSPATLRTFQFPQNPYCFPFYGHEQLVRVAGARQADGLR